jgi:hypothetical protein
LFDSIDLNENVEIDFSELLARSSRNYKPIIPEPRIISFDPYGMITIMWNVPMIPITNTENLVSSNERKLEED